VIKMKNKILTTIDKAVDGFVETFGGM